MPTTTGTEWLIIREVISSSPLVASDVDRSKYLHFGSGPSSLGGSERTTYGYVLNQRGQAEVALNASATDPYLPQVGWQIFLYDVSAAGQLCVFSGLINKVQTSWWGQKGDRLITLSCVSWEKVFDTVRVSPRIYRDRTCGFIVNDLLSVVAGWPGSAGDIEDGVTVDTFLVEGQPTLASLMDKLAQLSDFIWGIDPSTLEFNFTPPGLTPAPWEVTAEDALFEAFSFTEDEQDFRDRQYYTVDWNQATESVDFFDGDGHSTTFQLSHPAHAVNSAFITRNTRNHALATLTGAPFPTDTVTIGYPTAGSMFNWAPNSPYQVGYSIIDPSNHIQKVTSVDGLSKAGPTFGQSGPVQPAWNDVGGTTQDQGLVWTDQGALGLGTNVAGVYTFVLAIDNTQYGQVLIESSNVQTMQNLADAINSKDSTRGIKYSLPTWENPLVNADDALSAGGGSATMKVWNKGPGRGYIAALSEVSLFFFFSWSSDLTTGGITTFETEQISVGINSSGARSSGISYIVGLDSVSLPSPLNIGTSLSVGYYRSDANIIGVENTPLVSQRAIIEGGTGKYQALIAAPNSATLSVALAYAQASLRAFQVIPKTFEMITYRPGMRVGMAVSVGFTMPAGPDLEG